MFRLSNCVFSILNVLLMVFGLFTIVASLFIGTQGIESECQKFIQKPLLIIGLVFLGMSLLGLIGACCWVTLLLWIYSFVAYVMVLGTMCFMIFAFVVTNEGAGNRLSGIGYKEYRLGDYSSWLRNHFATGKNWEQVRSCLIDAQICQRFAAGDVNLKAEDFYKKELSPIQSGCCKPPTYCGFQYENATFWTVPKSGPAVMDPDCTTWSNNQAKLCYDCNSCKGGVLANIKKDWRNLTIINACILAFVLIIYSTSCCTRRNMKYRSSMHYKGYHP